MKAALWTGMFSPHCIEPEETIRELKECGFETAELSELELEKLLSDKRPEERALKFHLVCQECGLKLSQAHLPQILTIETIMTQDILSLQLEKALNVLELLEIPVAVIHPLKTENLPDDKKKQAEELTKKALLKAVNLGKEHGIRIAIENLIGISRAEIAVWLKEVPGLGLNLDTAHAASSNWDIPDAIKEFSEKLFGLHLSDNNGEAYDLHLSPGKGSLPWKQIIKELQKSGYSGDFHLELPHERGKTISQTRKNAKEIFSTVGEILCRKY
jgi:sugar phosphate isomerase/epimerase